MIKTISCPLCGGEIHAIAGRCKHCKADLVDLRERAARHARAQAMGATVPPPPRAMVTTPPPRPRGVTRPPPGPTTGPVPVMGPPAEAEHAGNGAFHAPHSTSPGAPAFDPATEAMRSPDHGTRPPDHAPPDHAAYRAPQSGPRPGGTPPYGVGMARSRPHRVSTWSRRWPLVVSAVALLAIGISIGVLAERWRRQAEGRAASRPRQSHVSRQPNMIPDRMPQPLMPAPPTPRAVPDQPPGTRPPAPAPDRAPAPAPDPQPDEPDEPEPDEPDPSNPGSRFSQPQSSQRGGDASAFRTFTTELTDSLCEKLTQCGVIDSATRSMCQVFADQLDAEDAADKVQRGECSFNRRAADACLRAVADMRCDTGSSDRVWDLLGPNQVGECAEAYVCN